MASPWHGVNARFLAQMLDNRAPATRSIKDDRGNEFVAPLPLVFLPVLNAQPLAHKAVPSVLPHGNPRKIKRRPRLPKPPK